MSDQPTDFAAERTFAALPLQTREKIIENVWCTQCRGAVRIVNFTVKTKPGGIALEGNCATCGHRVCRYMEDTKSETPYP